MKDCHSPEEPKKPWQLIVIRYPNWKKHKLESRLLGGISIISDMQKIYTIKAEREEELKSLLMKVKEESENLS